MIWRRFYSPLAEGTCVNQGKRIFLTVFSPLYTITVLPRTRTLMQFLWFSWQVLYMTGSCTKQRTLTSPLFLSLEICFAISLPTTRHTNGNHCMERNDFFFCEISRHTGQNDYVYRDCEQVLSNSWSFWPSLSRCVPRRSGLLSSNDYLLSLWSFLSLSLLL